MSASNDIALIDKARENFEAIAHHLSGEPDKFASNKTQTRWREDGKMALTVIGQHQGQWRNFATEEHGDICDQGAVLGEGIVRCPGGARC